MWHVKQASHDECCISKDKKWALDNVLRAAARRYLIWEGTKHKHSQERELVLPFPISPFVSSQIVSCLQLEWREAKQEVYAQATVSAEAMGEATEKETSREPNGGELAVFGSSKLDQTASYLTEAMIALDFTVDEPQVREAKQDYSFSCIRPCLQLEWREAKQDLYAQAISYSTEAVITRDTAFDEPQKQEREAVAHEAVYKQYGLNFQEQEHVAVYKQFGIQDQEQHKAVCCKQEREAVAPAKYKQFVADEDYEVDVNILKTAFMADEDYEVDVNILDAVCKFVGFQEQEHVAVYKQYEL
jgi:hypothetical protein